MIILLSIVAIFLIFSGILSIVLIRKQQKNELDKGMNATTVKHPILANPMLLAYLLLPIAGVILIFYFYKYWRIS
jgi:TRAP-type C4-dicarboxylate transport system permease small subunit